MALINCPECGGQVSDRAPACPHCGYPLREDGPKGPGGYAVVLMEAEPHPDETVQAIHKTFGKTAAEAGECLEHLPCVLQKGLSLAEAYTKADAFQHCGLVKVIEDGRTCDRLTINCSDPAPRPGTSADKPLTFGSVVGATMVGLLCWNLIMLVLSLFFH